MLPNALLKNYDQKRLRNLLAILFVALVVPTSVIIWQAYGQLKWEAFYQHRAQAEALTQRIDDEIARDIQAAANRSFADFEFLNVAQGGKLLQRSPLAAYPVNQDVPGTIGHFQVDADGIFSTPLLPSGDADPNTLGIDINEYEVRSDLAREIRQVLAVNKLVRERGNFGARLTIANEPVDTPAETPSPLRARTYPLDSDARASKDNLADSAGNAGLSSSGTTFEVASEELEEQALEVRAAYSQDVFDALNTAPASAPVPSSPPAVTESIAKRDSGRSLGRVEDLQLDEELQNKSAAAEKAVDEVKRESRSAQSQTRRTEQVALPEAELVQAGLEQDVADDHVTITTFASEIDPFEMSLLDSGHLVLFRKVWRNGERIIQGLLIDQDKFAEQTITSAFRGTTLARMSDLILGYDGDIIQVARGTAEPDYLRASNALQGTLLYRRALSAPFDGLELVYSINQLPRGPGAGVLAWSTIVIGVVFLAGFYALYRLGTTQIRLARQQQDFVSAVSHELKTPLTSIRMYGEMLKEGWADEAKQKQYYEYIHDESERLTRLISNVLQLAKITRSDPDVELRPIQVGELLSQIESKIASQVERAGFELRIDRDAETDDRKIEVDVDCFTQIVINLVDNAIKFSRDATEKILNISTRVSSDGTVTFAVRDYGPGIPKDQMKKIFQLFYRSESELTRETVGTGIGLAIVHQLVTAMQGRIDVINTDPGAQFNVSFPLL